MKERNTNKTTEEKLRKPISQEQFKPLKKGADLLTKALEEKIASCTPEEEAQALLMEKIHLQFLEELSYFHRRREIRLEEDAADKLQELLSKNPTRSGKLWLVFRYYKRLALWMGNHPKQATYYINTYCDMIAQSARHSISLYEKKVLPLAVLDLINSDFFHVPTYLVEGLDGVYFEHQTPLEISQQLQPIINLDPKEEYPIARKMQRKFIIHVGGTNTGKTYGSIQRLAAVPRGYYLAPLRLLALEVQETLKEKGVDCGMITGEEQDLAPTNTHIASTVEKINLSSPVDVAVLDECQMIADHDRGYAWTRAILGCPAKEIHCCVAPEGLDILKNVITYSGSPYEVEEHQRLVPLQYLDTPIPLEEAQSGDAFVAFSRREVLRIAHLLADSGIKASVIYGGLPYKARKLQMEQFLQGKTSVIVATDAIGMGLNLPIRRVIFTDKEKFDGKSTRALTSPEVKQIGGRAGRFGKYDKGFLTSTSRMNSVKRQFLATSPSHKQARLGFSEQILELDYELDAVLDAWRKTETVEPFIKTDVSRHIKMIALLRENRFKLTKQEIFRAINIPFNEDNYELLDLFIEYLRLYQQKATVLPMPKFTPSSRSGRGTLEDYELHDKELDLYYSFSSMFRYDYDADALAQGKEETSLQINQLLMDDMVQHPDRGAKYVQKKKSGQQGKGASHYHKGGGKKGSRKR